MPLGTPENQPPASGSAQTHVQLGIQCAGNLEFDQAEVALRRALESDPNLAAAHHQLAIVLRAKGDTDEAVASARRALAIRDDFAEAHNFLGVLCCDQAQVEQAIACFERALAIDSDFAQAHNNLGVIFTDRGAVDEAMCSLDRALEIRPDYPEAHLGRAHLLLQRGDFDEGWREYEWRWKCKSLSRFYRPFERPQWDGCDLAGRTVFLHAEQGLGDTIQFIRYAALVAERGGRIVVECQPELKRLLQRMPGIEDWFLQGHSPPPPTLYDVHCPLMSLPLACGTTLESIPARLPYLSACPEEVNVWRQRLAKDSARLKLGLVWAGNPIHPKDHLRSLPPGTLARLGNVQGVSFYSLQKENSGQPTSAPPAEFRMVNLTEDLRDFSDTAALIANLDMVIAVDTAVAHLAGALAKPVWTLLPTAADARWLIGREDTPWYPTMRLFRQRTAGDWGEVIERVAEALEVLRNARDGHSVQCGGGVC